MSLIGFTTHISVKYSLKCFALSLAVANKIWLMFHESSEFDSGGTVIYFTIIFSDCHSDSQTVCTQKTPEQMDQHENFSAYHIIFPFRRSVQDYKIHGYGNGHFMLIQGIVQLSNHIVVTWCTI
jgi:hypothetical protein